MMNGAAAQPPESVMDRLAGDAGIVSADGQAADPGSPTGPEHSPDFGGVRPIHLHRVVSAGRPLVAAHRSRLIGRRAGIDQQRDLINMHQAAEGIGMRMCRQ
jgi:hypothetical protein